MAYELKQSDIFDFARFVGAEYKQKGDELFFKLCPYCGGGPSHHDKNTFAINLVNGSFNCKRSSCGRTGNMITLHRDFGFSLGEGIDSYYDRESRYRRFKRPAEKIESNPVCSTMMSVNILNFQYFNKWYGRDKGDALLAELGKYFQQLCHDHDMIAGYMGNDYFSVFFENQ